MTPPSRRRLLGGLAAAGTVGLAGCSTLARLRGPNETPPESVGSDHRGVAAEWRYPNADSRNSARRDLATLGRPAPAWSLPPADDDCEVVAATRETAFVRLDDGGTVLSAHADGAERWRRRFDSDTFRPGGLVGDTLYASVGGADVLALDPADGTTRWRVPLAERLDETVPSRYLPTDSEWLSAYPLATPETLYVQTSYGLHGLDPDDGAARWRLHLGSREEPATRDRRYTNGLAVTGNELVATYGHPARSVVALSVYDGEPQVDSTRLRTEYASAPAFVGDQRGTFAVGQGVASTGVVTPLVAGYDSGPDFRWTFPGLEAGSGPVRVAPPATAEDRVVVPQVRPVGDGLEFALLALDAHTGALAWSYRERLGAFDTTDFFELVALAQPIVAGGTVIAGYATDPPGPENTTRSLVGLSVRDGEERWRLDPGVEPYRLAVAGNRVYVGGRNGGVAALSR